MNFTKLFVGTLALSAMLVACGDDSTSAKDTDRSEEVYSDLVVETFDDLPVCSDNRDGVTAYVKDEKTAYVCVDGDWTLDGENPAEKSSSSEKTSSSSSFVYEQNSSAYDQPEVVAVNNKTVSGVSQKGPFVTGSAVKLYELDGTTYAQTGKSFTGKIASDDGKFSVASVTLASQYALLEANGYFRNEVSGKKSSGTITLNALTDLSDREKVNINLLTHLEYERALYLIGTGINVPFAKKQAEAEIFNAFGIQGEFANSEDLDIFSSGDGNAALLAFSVLMLRGLSEADLTELLTKFATDIEKDGSWDDEATKTNIADWAQEKDLAGGLAAIRSNVEGWNLGTVPDFEKYVRNFWYVNYGLGECGSTNEGDVIATQNELSTTYGSQMRFICKSGAWVEASDIEKNTYGEKCTSAEVGSIISGKVTETNKYYCSETGWISLMGWRWDIPKEVRLNPDIDYGSMTDSRDGKKYKTVIIGTQTWMAENLNYADSVTTTSLKGKSWCYNDVAANCDVGGRLYTWAAAIDSVKLVTDAENPMVCGYDKYCRLSGKVQGICPEGWHLPSYDEWNTLFTAVGGSSTAGAKLKSQTGWDESGNGTDAFGFSALPAGSRYNDGRYINEGYHAIFWSSTEDISYDAYYMILHYRADYASLINNSKNNGHSVRCVKD